MGKSRRKYNWKGRPTVETVTDESQQKKIKLDLGNEVGIEKYDSANALVLPSNKRRTTKLRDKNAPPVKLLSKRQRKKLEKIVEQKEKKANHVSLLASLDLVKAAPEDLACLTQLQSTQTLGRKKFLADVYTTVDKDEEAHDRSTGTLSGVKGGRKRKRSPISFACKHGRSEGSVIQLGEASSSEEESSGDSEDENIFTKVISTVMADIFEQEKDDLVKPVKAVVDKPIVEVEHTLKVTNVQGSIQHIATKFVALDRDPVVQNDRLRLPVLAEEQVIMEAINEHPVTVIVGPTGSGKTTQVPQFLYEAGYASDGKIVGITEPRRVAAITMSQRVGFEMGLTSREVSYQIRYEGNATHETKIKFMTDGVLLKEIQMDPTLKKYSAIVIDEAHERSVFSDILIGILSRIIPQRELKGDPLKLVIMSATLRVEDFTENARLFKVAKPPVVKVDARMFDVTVHFNKRTDENYLEESFKKVCKIHRQLPDGGILVFLTGQQEVNSLCSKLRHAFPMKSHSDNTCRITAFKRRRIEAKEKNCKQSTDSKMMVLPKVKLDDFVSALPDDTEDDGLAEDDEIGLIDDNSEGVLDDEDCENDGRKGGEAEQPMWVLPLYSMLPPDRQRMVFEPPPEGTRLCIVATNVAETSLTIANVKYVVDCGKVKEKVYDKVTGVSMFLVTWVSQASANQRAGRAGRTAPGHCYRLYSSAVFNDEFQPFSRAEIERRPIDDLILVMKSMNLPVINFPFPTPPDYLQIRHGIKRLITLGALKESKVNADIDSHKGKKKPPNKDMSCITPLGKAMSAFPLSPRYGKMMALSHQQELMPFTVILVAALTVQEVLIERPIGNEGNLADMTKRWQNLRLTWSGSGNQHLLGDAMVLLRAVGAVEFQGGGFEWCNRNGLRHKAVVEIRKLRRQLTSEINLIIPSCHLTMDPKMDPPSDEQARLLRQVVLAGSIDHVARRVDDFEVKDPADKPKWKGAYRTTDMEEPIFLQSTSVLKDDMPLWVVYQDVFETNKLFMRTITAIEPEWLPIFAPQLCSFSPPLETPTPRYDADRDVVLCHRLTTFGPLSWQLPEAEVEFPSGRDLFRWFAFFFLGGHVCPALKSFTSNLLEIKTLVNPVAIRFREQRNSLLCALMSLDVNSATKLESVWKEHPKFLLREYLQWLQDESLKQIVRKLWPPVRQKAADCEWD